MSTRLSWLLHLFLCKADVAKSVVRHRLCIVMFTPYEQYCMDKRNSISTDTMYSIFDVEGLTERFLPSNDKKVAAIPGVPDGTYPGY